MKLLLLSDINSPHTQKWAIALAGKGFHIAVFSVTMPIKDWYTAHQIELLSPKTKVSYFSLLSILKKAITQFMPQIIHAHYATSYGFLGALSGFHPFVISAWGSDVMAFPDKSFLHKKLLKYNFKKADCICATSDVLVSAIKKISKKNIYKIPFGIDTNNFKPFSVTSVFPKPTIVIGTVKSLETIYGIDILIRAFKKVNATNMQSALKLLIVGSGSREEEYKRLTEELAIADKVVFTGKVEHSEVVDYHNMIDIFINVSRNESFGVSVLEASACGKPVVVSNIGGLKEVVANGDTGFLIESENVEAIASAMDKLIKNEALRKEMGAKGRLLVQSKFDLNTNVDAMIAIYKELLNQRT